MIKILFVCHGNICRSPMAEFILKDMLQQQHIQDKFYVASAATSTEEIWNGIGNPVYPPAKKELAKHGISCEGKRAVQLKKEDYDRYDYLIGMDHANMRNMHRLFGGDRDGKLHLLLEYAGLDRDIVDPWYTGQFDKTYEDIIMGCEGLMQQLLNRL